jgi:signal transduction histidine kinase
MILRRNRRGAVRPGTVIADSRTAQRERPRRDDRPALETVGEWSHFLSGLVHELQTPLASLGMIAELLDKETGSGAEEKRKRYTAQLGTLTREIQTLVQDVGFLARLVGGRTRVTRGAVALADAVEGPAEAVRARAWAHGVSLSTMIDADPTTVLHTDAGHLEHALTALLETAVALADREVSMRVAVSGSEAVFTLQPDAGCGVDDPEALFDPFASPVSRSLKQQGARPLAPLLARQLARALGGDARVASDGGHTRCVLRIPLREPEA